MNHNRSWRRALMLHIGLAAIIFAGMSATNHPVCAAYQQEQGAEIAWADSLDEAVKNSAVSGKPLLLKFEAEWCGPCKQLSEEFAKPGFKEISKSVILVKIDVDKQPAVVEEFDVTGIPRVLLVDSNLEIIADKVGFAEIDQWVTWVSDAIKGTEFEMPEVLASTEPPTRTEITELLDTLGARDPTLRQVTIERLVAFPSRTRSQLIDLLMEKGKLAHKLSALEILDRWQAPTEGLDPWVKDSFTPERLKQLSDWKETPIEELGSVLSELTPADLESAEKDIAHLLKSKNARVSLSRLTQYGPNLLPLVYEKIKVAQSDEETSRLTALRYWLTASNELRLGWAGGLIELASSDLDSRRNAVQGLIKRASLPDQTLLLELFADSDPLVRELSLKGLRQIGAKETNETLARLLNDPDANVRAAVLKQFAESETKSTQIVTAVSKYLETETDADLIVHGLRFLKSATGDDAVNSVLRFVKHESWQVRAEAAETLGEFDSDDLSIDALVLKGEAVMTLLDDTDGFVVSRALKSLPTRKNKKLLGDLTEIAFRKPELASAIVESIVESVGHYSYDKDSDSAAPYFKKFISHDLGEIRLAGINGMAESYAGELTDAELSVLLKDKDERIRIASMKAVLEKLNKYRSFREDVSNRSRVESSLSITPRPRGLAGLFGFGNWSSPSNGGKTIKPKLVEPIELPRASGSIAPTIEPVDEEPVDEEPVDEEQVGEEQVGEEQVGEERKPLIADQVEPDEKQEAIAEEESAQKKLKLPKLVGEAWLRKWIAGEIEFELDESREEITRLSESENLIERTVALACRLAMGEHETVLDDFMAEAISLPEKERKLLPDMLRWLPPEERTRVFKSAVAAAISSAANSEEPQKSDSEKSKRNPELQYLLEQYVEIRNPESATTIWEVAKTKGLTVYDLYRSLLKVNFANSVSYYSSLDRDQIEPDLLVHVKQQVEQYVDSDHPVQQKLALMLIQKLDLAAGKKLAEKLFESTGDDSVEDLAFRVLLKPDNEDRRDRYGNSIRNDDRSHAVQYLGTDDPERYKTALKYMAIGDEVLNGDDNLRLTSGFSSYGYSNNDVKVRIPKPPTGMTLEHLSPDDFEADDETVALTVYFRSLLDAETDLKPLLEYWSAEPKNEDVAKLVYEAVASTNNDKLISHVEEIVDTHGERSTSFMANLYWTIRVMDGKNALKLRKKIRAKVGMSRLNNY